MDGMTTPAAAREPRPPFWSGSRTVTCAPRLAKRYAADKPTMPAPATITSQCDLMIILQTIMTGIKDSGFHTHQNKTENRDHSPLPQADAMLVAMGDASRMVA